MGCGGSTARRYATEISDELAAAKARTTELEKENDDLIMRLKELERVANNLQTPEDPFADADGSEEDRVDAQYQAPLPGHVTFQDVVEFEDNSNSKALAAGPPEGSGSMQVAATRDPAVEPIADDGAEVDPVVQTMGNGIATETESDLAMALMPAAAPPAPQSHPANPRRQPRSGGPPPRATASRPTTPAERFDPMLEQLVNRTRVVEALVKEQHYVWVDRVRPALAWLIERVADLDDSLVVRKKKDHAWCYAGSCCLCCRLCSCAKMRKIYSVCLMSTSFCHCDRIAQLD